MNAKNAKRETAPRRALILRTTRFMIRSAAKVNPCTASGVTTAAHVAIADKKVIDLKTAAVAARGEALLREESAMKIVATVGMITTRRATDVRYEIAKLIMINTAIAAVQVGNATLHRRDEVTRCT